MTRLLLLATLAAACAAALYACGTAAIVCTPPDVACATNVCANLKSDPNHCGSCDLACATGQTCVDGGCLCQGGAQLCPAAAADGGRPSGICVNTSTDPLNCGGCGVACPQGSTCGSSPDGGVGCR